MVNNEVSSNSLTELMCRLGEPISATANRPIDLNDGKFIWFVESGGVDILLAEYEDDDLVSPYKHFVRLEVGRLAVGVAENQYSMTLIAKGLSGTVLRKVSCERLLSELLSEDESVFFEFDRQINEWIVDTTAAVVREVEGRPQTNLRLTPGEVTGKGTASTDQRVLWIDSEFPQFGFLDLVDTCAMLPITSDSWVRIDQEVNISCKSTAELDKHVLLEKALPSFHDLILGAESLNRRLLMLDEANLQLAQSSKRRREREDAISELETLYMPAEDHEESELWRALRVIGQHEGIEIRKPTVASNEQPSLAQYCEASALRVRRLRLTAEKSWWLGDSGAMLAFRSSDERPVVLLPGRAGRYRVLDPVTGETQRVDESTADGFREAYLLYRGLKRGGESNLRDLLSTGSSRAIGALVILLLSGIVGGVLALLPAIAVNLLIQDLMPRGEAGALLQLGAALVGLAIVATLLHIIRGTALMRLEGRFAARLDAAIWDRLLRLRPGFFRDSNSGELATRAMAMREIRDHVAGVASDGVLAIVFLLPALGLLYYYDVWLGSTAVLLALAMVGITAIFCAVQIEPQRRFLQTSRKLAGNIQQFISGIKKIHTTGAQDSAFAAWASQYRSHKQAEIQISVVGEHLAAFGAATPALASAALFWVAVTMGDDTLPLADFLAIFTASMVLCLSIVMLGNSTRSIAYVRPAFEQLYPILKSPIATGYPNQSAPTLSGEIVFDNVSFSYDYGSSMVLDQVSIHVRPGEFVAIVGESGAGKSTIFRLALGLEVPNSGAIYYDGRDLSQLNLDAVRRQIGVVMQDTSPTHGRVIDVINGLDSTYTEDDAWRALRQAGIEDEVLALPMQLYTTVGENSSTFSGGQNQRLQIAAALVRNPRVLFLDEPTSWLDTKNQAVTMTGIEQTTSTRIVIAHRLSTIRQANRIYVMKNGRVAQTGTYDELFNEEGPFRSLAMRQKA